MEKYSYKDECIVCDAPIKTESLLLNKKRNKKKVFESLDDNTKKILTDIIELINGIDPFDIKGILIKAIEKGDKSLVNELKDEIDQYFDILNDKINNLFATCLDDSDLVKKSADYNAMINSKPEMTDEDVLFIEQIINENIDKEIELERDKENNLKLFLGGVELINKERKELHLSTGEQNFISLTFEFLKAKNSEKEIIVLDDPVSSFDSIYKNKIAYAIIKFLEKKNQIILTHNTDLIRLLECQCQGCFNLYLFNNVESEKNGFIKVNKKEQEILLYLDKLLDLFRKDIFDEIEDEKTFLISMIPFMRGYAQIIADTSTKDKLTRLMHGYINEKENITEIYNRLFKENNIKNDYEISVDDIIHLDIDSIKILKDENYPLLNKTLKHTLTYLYLRLNVEKKLVDTYNINTRRCDQLGQIINKAFSDVHNMKKRIFLTSRKTLLNEFNHFEGNMNIFQPAIDISDTALENEKSGILEFLKDLTV